MKNASILILIASSIIISAGCKSLPDNPPVPQDKMSKILLDIQIGEAYSMGLGDSVNNKFEKNYDSLGIFYHSIFKRYNVSFDDFKDAMKWYEARPVMMDSLLTNVINQLSEIKTKEKIKDYDPSAENKPKPSIDTLQKNKDTLSVNKTLKKTNTKDTVKTGISRKR